MINRLRFHPSHADLLVGCDGSVFLLRGITFVRLHVRESNGYPAVTINGATTRVHTLVLEAFKGSRPSGMQGRHLDGNRCNNHVTNLAWGTPAENGADTVRHGRSTRGSRNARAKLTEVDVRAIKVRLAEGDRGRDIAHDFGVSEQTICGIRKGREWSWLT